MAAWLRGHLSYANVMATLAVFIALGGTSYAVTRLDKNSVFSQHIVNREVKTADLADGAASAAKIRTNAVNSGKVVNNSLRGADIDEGTLSGVPVETGFALGSAPAPSPTLWRFLVLPAWVTVGPGDAVLVTSNRAFGSSTLGGAHSLDLYICHRPEGSTGTPASATGGILDNRVPQNSA